MCDKEYGRASLKILFSCRKTIETSLNFRMPLEFNKKLWLCGMDLYSHVPVYIGNTATFWLTSFPLVINWGYDQNFLRKFHFKLLKNVIKNFVSNYISLFRWRNCFYYFATARLLIESSLTYWKVCIPPYFLFSTYDEVFRTYPIRNSGSTCMMYDPSK
jgi:hypothetical protein